MNQLNKDQRVYKILFISTHYRISEKLFGIFPELSKIGTIDIYCVGQMNLNKTWDGDIDLRFITFNKFKLYINKFVEIVNVEDYDVIIYDDNRIQDQLGIPHIYQQAKQHGVLMIGNSHGNKSISQKTYEGFNICYDYAFCFGKFEYDQYNKIYPGKLLVGGIPINDELKYCKVSGKYLLVIPNFTADRSSPFSCNFDKRWAIQSVNISKLYNIPIVIKQKTRTDSPDYSKHVDFINSLYDDLDIKPTIINDTDDINKLISNSSLVMSAISTLAFKPIQLNIPTILIQNSGDTGNFKNYPYTYDINTSDLSYKYQEIDNQLIKKFITETIAGGNDFESAKLYIQELKKILIK